LVISEGAVVEEGSHNELIAHGRRYYDLYTRQFRRDRELAFGLAPGLTASAESS
jgi:hypothetical protein